MEALTEVSWITGYKTIPRIKYFIRAKKVPFLYFFSKVEYYVENDFMTLGPFKSTEACMENLTMGGIGIRDIELDV